MEYILTSDQRGIPVIFSPVATAMWDLPIPSQVYSLLSAMHQFHWLPRYQRQKAERKDNDEQKQNTNGNQGKKQNVKTMMNVKTRKNAIESNLFATASKLIETKSICSMLKITWIRKAALCSFLRSKFLRLDKLRMLDCKRRTAPQSCKYERRNIHPRTYFWIEQAAAVALLAAKIFCER